MALWNPLRQGLHDKAAGTLVVRNALDVEPVGVDRDSADDDDDVAGADGVAGGRP